MNVNVGDFLARRAAVTPDREAYVDPQMGLGSLSRS